MLFAVDSIPAILSITRDAFIVYTSNVFAILGLRSMYFALAGMMEMFRYLHYGLSLVLMFVGAKMLASHYYDIPTAMALAIVAECLLISVLASLAHPKKRRDNVAGKDREGRASSPAQAGQLPAVVLKAQPSREPDASRPESPSASETSHRCDRESPCDSVRPRLSSRAKAERATSMPAA